MIITPVQEGKAQVLHPSPPEPVIVQRMGQVSSPYHCLTLAHSSSALDWWTPTLCRRSNICFITPAGSLSGCSNGAFSVPAFSELVHSADSTCTTTTTFKPNKTRNTSYKFFILVYEKRTYPRKERITFYACSSLFILMQQVSSTSTLTYQW